MINTLRSQICCEKFLYVIKRHTPPLDHAFGMSFLSKS